MAILGGLIGSLWNAGFVRTIGTGLGLTNGTLTATGGIPGGWNSGSVNAIGTGLELPQGTAVASGTLSADWQGGSVTTIGSGLSVNAGTIAATGGTGGSQAWFPLGNTQGNAISTSSEAKATKGTSLVAVQAGTLYGLSFALGSALVSTDSLVATAAVINSGTITRIIGQTTPATGPGGASWSGQPVFDFAAGGTFAAGETIVGLLTCTNATTTLPLPLQQVTTGNVADVPGMSTSNQCWSAAVTNVATGTVLGIDTPGFFIARAKIASP